jgi:hypothetical protein
LSETPEEAVLADATPCDDGGGDPVCWLHLVCESCGALLEREDDPHRPGCDAATLH